MRDLATSTSPNVSNVQPRTVARASTQNRLVGGFGAVTQANASEPSSILATKRDEESWDTFDDWEASIPTKKPATKVDAIQTKDEKNSNEHDTFISI